MEKRDLRQLQQQKKPPKIGKPAASGQAKKKKVSEIPVRLATKVSAARGSEFPECVGFALWQPQLLEPTQM